MSSNAFSLTSSVNHLSQVVDNVNGNGMGQFFGTIFASAERVYEPAKYLAWDEITQRMNVPAPFGQECGPANKLIGAPYTIKAIPHPYINIGTDICCDGLRRVRPGPNGAPGSIQDNYLYELDKAARYLKESLMTRLDLMTSQQLLTGAFVVDGPTIQTQQIDLARNPAHTVALLGPALWTAATATPLTNLDQWDALLSLNGSTSGFDVLSGANVWPILRANDGFAKSFLSCCDKEQGNLLLNPVGGDKSSLIQQGTFRNRRLWTSNATYFDVATGTQKPLIPLDTIIMVGDVKPLVSFSAIMDLEAGYQPLEFFVKQKKDECNGVELQSSPLALMRNINGTLAAKVI